MCTRNSIPLLRARCFQYPCHHFPERSFGHTVHTWYSTHVALHMWITRKPPERCLILLPHTQSHPTPACWLLSIPLSPFPRQELWTYSTHVALHIWIARKPPEVEAPPRPSCPNLKRCHRKCDDMLLGLSKHIKHIPLLPSHNVSKYLRHPFCLRKLGHVFSGFTKTARSRSVATPAVTDYETMSPKV